MTKIVCGACRGKGQYRAGRDGSEYPCLACDGKGEVVKYLAAVETCLWDLNHIRDELEYVEGKLSELAAQIKRDDDGK